MFAETHYAKNGKTRIAYQVLGNGSFDLVIVPGFISHLDCAWEEPGLAAFLKRLASFSRLILFDKRGTGLSDRTGAIPTFEERIDDVCAVMDAAGSSKANIFGIAEGGPLAMLFAATLPERTRALVLYGTYAHFRSSVGSAEKLDRFIDLLDRTWGTGESLSLFAPSRVKDGCFRQWWARYERSSACPSSVGALARRYADVDVTAILPAIRARTLVLHRADDCRVSVQGGRYLAEHISGTKYVELPGHDHLLWATDTERLGDEVEEFLTGSRPISDDDRVLATVLFTDIVDSTKRAQELGDRKWRAILEYHDEMVLQEIKRFRGRVIKTLGDGFLATFDSPARAVLCASNIVASVRLLGLEVRTGLHTGEVQFKGGDVAGLSVTVAARISAVASGDQILVSRTVRDLVVGSGIRFADYGVHTLKGLKKEMHLYEVDSTG